MKIDIWSDFACPYCYIGEKHLKQALGDIDAEIIFHSFELDPNMSAREHIDVYTSLAKKYGMSLAQAKAQCASIEKMAQEAGLEFDIGNIKLANTFNAHRIAQFANSNGKGNAFVETAMQAYFCDGEDFSDKETLLKLALSVGLVEEEVRRILNTEEYAESVREDEKAAEKINITSVPFFVFDERYSISGAQPPETFKQVIAKCKN